MAVIYDHAITDARRLVARHQPLLVQQITRCVAGLRALALQAVLHRLGRGDPQFQHARRPLT